MSDMPAIGPTRRAKFSVKVLVIRWSNDVNVELYRISRSIIETKNAAINELKTSEDKVRVERIMEAHPLTRAYLQNVVPPVGRCAYCYLLHCVS